MKLLLILRHAEADAAVASQSDAQRPLTAAGRAQAQRLGAIFRERGLEFQQVLCSTALRARETAESVVAASAIRVALDLRDALYGAPGEALLDELGDIPGNPECVLLVAHMPGVAELAGLLLAAKGAAPLNFAPCTLAEIALNVNRWAEVKARCGTLRLLLSP